MTFVFKDSLNKKAEGVFLCVICSPLVHVHLPLDERLWNSLPQKCSELSSCLKHSLTHEVFLLPHLVRTGWEKSTGRPLAKVGGMQEGRMHEFGASSAFPAG